MTWTGSRYCAAHDSPINDLGQCEADNRYLVRIAASYRRLEHHYVNMPLRRRDGAVRNQINQKLVDLYRTLYSSGLVR